MCKSISCLVENEGKITCVSCFSEFEQGTVFTENTDARKRAAEAADHFRKRMEE